MDLLVRGPVTAIAGFMSAASWGIGTFFFALRSQAIDCAVGSTTAKACALDIVEIVLATIVTTAGAAGAAAVGFTTPTPRDLAMGLSSSPVFRVDGLNVSWAEGMAHHRYGLNRTLDDPAVVEYQFNTTSAIHKYISYEHEGNLIMRHPTGFHMPATGTDRRRARGCEVYIDTAIASDTLRSSELQRVPSHAAFYGLGEALFNYMSSHHYDSDCMFLGTDDGVAGAKFDIGASCAKSVPNPHACQNAEYTVPLYRLSTS